MEKTAMQQLKEKLEEEIKNRKYGNNYSAGYYSALKNTIMDIDSQMMAIEKGIIKDAYFVGTMRQFQGGDHYYNQTFEK